MTTFRFPCSRRARRHVTAIVLGGATGALMLAASTPAHAQSYGGSATGASITVPTTGTTIRAVTGSAPIGGGGAEASLLVGDIPSSATGGVAALSAAVMHSVIVGTDATRAEASTAEVSLSVSNNTITADFIMARGTASCGPAVSGDSTLPNLVINGQAITVTGAANQTVSLPNGTAVINEQTSSINGTTAAITVNALHVTTTDSITHQQLADVVVAQAAPQIDCQGVPPTSSFGTGGGWIPSSDAIDKANFGVVGGVQPNSTQIGHVVFDDHGVNVTFKSSTVNVTFPGACQTTISGTGQENGVDGFNYSVTITDGGEPGAGKDLFSIRITDSNNVVVYTNSNFLSGGNIQQHNQTCGS